MVSAISEDFSFPKMNNPLPHFAFTPSLWRVSSVVHPDLRDNDDDDGEDELDFANKSSAAYSASDHEGQQVMMISLDQEEKMDLLWEDFNEELEIQRVCDSMGNNKYKSQNSDGLNSESSRAGSHVKQQIWCTVKKKGSPFRFRIFSCVKTEFKIPRNRMISADDQPKIRPTSVFVVFKVLKSIFWLRRSSSDHMN